MYLDQTSKEASKINPIKKNKISLKNRNQRIMVDPSRLIS